MGNKRSMVLILSGFSIVLIALFFSLPMLIEGLVTYRLAQLGFANTDLSFDDISLTTTQLRLKNLIYNTRQHQFSLKAEKILLHYTFNKLLSGKIDHIHLFAVKLQVQDNLNSTTHDTSEPFSFPLVSARLPFQHLTLDHMRIENTSTSGYASKINLQGKLRSDTNGIKGMFTVSAGLSMPVQVNIMQDKSQSQIEITDPEKKSSVMSLSASPFIEKEAQQQTDITLKADLHALQELLANWRIVSDHGRVTGSFTASGQLAWPRKKRLAGELELADIRLDVSSQLDVSMPSGFAYAEDINLKLPLAIELQHRVLRWHLGKDTRATFYPRPDQQTGDAGLQAFWAAQGKQEVTIHAPDGLTGQLQLDNDFINQPTIRSDNALHITYGDDTTALALQQILSNTIINLYTPFTVKSDVTFTNAIRLSSWAHAKSGHWTGAGQVRLTENDLAIELAPDNHISIESLVYGALTIPSIDARLTTTSKCLLQPRNASWSCKDLNLDLTIPETNISDKRILTGNNKIQISELAKSSTEWMVTAQSVLSAMIVSAYNHTIKLDSIKTVVHANHRQARMDVKLSAADGLATASWNAVHKLDSNTGQAEYAIQPIAFTSTNQILSRLLDSGDFPININAGVLTASGSLSWQARAGQKDSYDLLQSAQIAIQDVGGTYRDTSFSGLNTTLDLRGDKFIHTEKPVPVQLAKLDTGLVLSDISFDLGITSGTGGLPLITARQFSASLLGGEISSDHVQYDLSQKENRFTLQVDQLDVEELLKAYQDKNLYGTGIVDGILPFIITGEGLKMTNGKLSAREPGGVLRYIANETVKGMAKDNQNMGILIEAMNDFHYSVLETKLAYKPDGILNMFLQIEGYNPSLKGGKPVHLNINLEENILDLIRSLKLADDIGEEIGKHLQK